MHRRPVPPWAPCGTGLTGPRPSPSKTTRSGLGVESSSPRMTKRRREEHEKNRIPLRFRVSAIRSRLKPVRPPAGRVPRNAEEIDTQILAGRAPLGLGDRPADRVLDSIRTSHLDEGCTSALPSPSPRSAAPRQAARHRGIRHAAAASPASAARSRCRGGEGQARDW